MARNTRADLAMGRGMPYCSAHERAHNPDTGWHALRWGRLMQAVRLAVEMGSAAQIRVIECSCDQCGTPSQPLGDFS